MNDEHKKFHDRIQDWLSGQLSSDEVGLFEKHCKQCPECAARAQAEKDLWELLGAVQPENQGSVPSVWPQVQERVFGDSSVTLVPVNNWFFGRGQLVRASLAAGAVAAGLMAGILVPGMSGEASAEDVQNDLWVSESSWLDVSATDGLAAIWLDPGLPDESDGS